MTNTTIALRRQIGSASDLKSVVRTMKASAASAIGQYERSVAALGDYARTVELGLGVCLRSVASEGVHAPLPPPPAGDPVVHAVVFGSDQGLVGRFNEAIVEHALAQLATGPAKVHLWAVGERVLSRLQEARRPPEGAFPVPGSVEQITRLVGQILLQIPVLGGETEADSAGRLPSASLVLFYNRPSGVGYAPVSQRLLPLDRPWQRELAGQPWPTRQLPEVLGASAGAGAQALRAFIREHLFVSLFRASAESLASENASRLAAMQRADKNIGVLLTELGARLHRLRQSGIDEELFDVIAGFDAMTPETRPGH
jgi:F-type H+-transporting ATPase subunit gamma